MTGKKLIVNADDYGHSRGTSQGIRQAHLQGIVTSTSVMINYPGADQDLRDAVKECSKLGLGLHLVLTSGKPLLSGSEVPTLVDQEGNFFKLTEFINNRQKLDLSEVEKEWRAQIAAFQKAIGRSPDHLDSHHHSSYTTPGLFGLMVKLANEISCPVRLPFGEEGTLFEDQAGSVEILAFVKKRLCYAQRFINSFYDQNATLENLKSILKSLKEDREHQSFELMCHPAWVDEELRRTSSYNEQRAREMAVLCAPEISRMVSELGIELIPFSGLC